MKKERTNPLNDDIEAWADSTRKELRSETKAQLIDLCIWLLLKDGVRKQVIEPKFSEAVLGAPKQLARRGAQARAATEKCLFEKKIEFLFQQKDISHTEGLARRLDREFGIKGRQPEEDEPASRGSKDVVRDWNKFRSASKTEETAPLTHQKA